MKLKDFLDNLNRLVKEDETLLELDVTTSSDDEGNSVNDVYYSPSVIYSYNDEQVAPEDNSLYNEMELARKVLLN